MVEQELQASFNYLLMPFHTLFPFFVCIHNFKTVHFILTLKAFFHDSTF